MMFEDTRDVDMSKVAVYLAPVLVFAWTITLFA